MNTRSWIFCLFLLVRALEARALTNTASISPNLMFYVETSSAIKTNEFKSNDRLIYVIKPKSDTNVFFRRLPDSQMLDFHLFSSDGKEVTKTVRGLTNSQPVHIPKSRDEVRSLKGHDAPIAWELFRPEQMFVITNRGVYELQLRVRLWAQTTNTGPNYEFMQHFDKSIDTNTCFGVVVSEPIRIKVIKE